MNTDLYGVLGVSRGADSDAIKKAFRRLAKEHHPDRNPGDAQAERRFKEASRAFEVLSDPERRGLYDKFGARSLEPGFDPSWAKQRSQDRGFGEGAGGMFDLDDLMSQLFGGDRTRSERRARSGSRDSGWTPRGPAVRASLTVDFLAAVQGGERHLTFEDGRSLRVRIPPGARDGETLRLRGKGGPDRGGGAPDLLLTIRVDEHDVFRRVGEDLHVDVPITVGEALQGARVEVPTPSGTVRVTVPAGTQPGQKLRVKGKGVARRGEAAGSLVVRLQVRLPDALEPEALKQVMEVLESGYREHPREEPAAV